MKEKETEFKGTYSLIKSNVELTQHKDLIFSKNYIFRDISWRSTNARNIPTKKRKIRSHVT